MRIYGENDRLIDAIVEVAWTTHARATPPWAIVDPIVGKVLGGGGVGLGCGGLCL
jgi:hypothetical protein